MFYVYLLKSLRDGRYYIGQTQDVVHRLKCHNSGLVLSTRSRRPFVLVGVEKFWTRNDARWFEYSLKEHGDKKKRFIKKMQEKVASGS
ncbi:hypothetical protein A2210_01430 [Candidatus Woesebacteria bacterium RIFOXYA1_FULL_40_18]|uniref:GIY-YIG domain-containing protein n=2 Tax=Candidatus Woeseibacteriota TaxID=1752722 RepID=A0A1F8CJN9_9BACT|nr:MAG: hypothetical protein A2210_01430 [Candidatus Woesebacteria bacterium RIFOXYA1_FULL_40_18]OGM80359.1 MAG: hypothetical protein A2361_02875 [Candidatus Woesebacteria bacterium RIFOXYB1_FULL_40_26]